MRPRLYSFSGPLALTLALTACGPSNPFDRDDPFSPTVRLGLPSYIWSYELAETWNFYEAQLAHLMFEGLTIRSEGEVLEPGLARAWDVSRDGTVYTFDLRTGVRFHDGSVFDATAVVAAWEKALAQPGDSITFAWMLDRIAGAREFNAGEAASISGLRVLNDSTLEVRLGRPYTSFPLLISLPQAAIGAAASSDTVPIGTGPWRFVAGEAGFADEIWLSKNHEYWSEPPALDSLVVRVIPDTLLDDALSAGWIDVTWDLPMPLSHDLVDRVDVGFVQAPSQGLMRLVIDLTNPVFQDVRVRQGLNHAIDRRMGAFLSGSLNAVPANGAVPAGVPGSDPARAGYVYDPVRAAELLRTGGYPMDRPLVIWVPEPTAVDFTAGLGDFLRDSFEALGLSVRLIADDERYDDVFRNGEADLRLEAWYGDFPDGEAFLYPLFSSQLALGSANDGSYTNPDFDRLIAAAAIESNGLRRMGLLRSADSVAYWDAANVFLWYTGIGTGYSTRLVGWTPAPHRTRFTSLSLRDSPAVFRD